MPAASATPAADEAAPAESARAGRTSGSAVSAAGEVSPAFTATPRPFSFSSAQTASFSPSAPAPAQLDDAPAVRLLTDTLREAARRNASDVHVEPLERGWRIRLRIDGVLHDMPRPPAHLRDAFVTRIKVLARMDIAERRVPQDGRLRLVSATLSAPASSISSAAPENGDHYSDYCGDDYRVSSLPTLFGEKLVLRRLDTLPADLSLAALGFDARQQKHVARALGAPHGLVLVTGPTGSGKTLSLYCFLQMLNTSARNLCSVEDPAEIQLAGINQVNVREKAGLTFAVALRAFLRQDPDIIMVGEIRDEETADVAVKAALTGHLVLSTLHTNDASAAIARLTDIGVAPHNLAAALRLVTAQRLVRRLCVACRAPVDDPLSLPAIFTNESASKSANEFAGKFAGEFTGESAHEFAGGFVHGFVSESVNNPMRESTIHATANDFTHASAQTPASVRAAHAMRAIRPPATQLYGAVGCPACHGIGYRGRIGIHEVMPVSNAMRELIVGRASTHDIARQARAENVATLRDAALARVRDGTTSPAEALGVTDTTDAAGATDTANATNVTSAAGMP